MVRARLEVGGQLAGVEQVRLAAGGVAADVGVVDERGVVRVVVGVVGVLGAGAVVARHAHALLVGLPALAVRLQLVTEVRAGVVDVRPVRRAGRVGVAARDGEVVLVAGVVDRVVVGHRGALGHQAVEERHAGGVRHDRRVVGVLHHDHEDVVVARHRGRRRREHGRGHRGGQGQREVVEVAGFPAAVQKLDLRANGARAGRHGRGGAAREEAGRVVAIGGGDGRQVDRAADGAAGGVQEGERDLHVAGVAGPAAEPAGQVRGHRAGVDGGRGRCHVRGLGHGRVALVAGREERVAGRGTRRVGEGAGGVADHVRAVAGDRPAGHRGRGVPVGGAAAGLGVPVDDQVAARSGGDRGWCADQHAEQDRDTAQPGPESPHRISFVPSTALHSRRRRPSRQWR